MAEKLFEDVDELLEEKSMSTSKTKTVGMKITEFLQKIYEKKFVDSPRFNLGGVEFFIRVRHNDENPQCEFIGVFLMNGSKKDQTFSVTFLEGSGTRESFKKITALRGQGFLKFLSLEKFRTWAFIHGDVFQLKATVTLHQKGTGDDWIRYFSPVCLSCFLVPISSSFKEPTETGGAQVSGKQGHHLCSHQGHYAG